jgi:hypothetical protein
MGGGTKGTPNNFKTKLCENFAKGSCTYAERCHFAHGEAELRSSEAAPGAAAAATPPGSTIGPLQQPTV